MDIEYKDIKVYRFKTYIFPGNKNTEFRANNPVPIYSTDRRLLGFANLTTYSDMAALECGINPATPERLDLELQNPRYWMDAMLEYRYLLSGAESGSHIAWVKALVMTTTELPGQDAIGRGELS